MLATSNLHGFKMLLLLLNHVWTVEICTGQVTCKEFHSSVNGSKSGNQAKPKYRDNGVMLYDDCDVVALVEVIDRNGTCTIECILSRDLYHLSSLVGNPSWNLRLCFVHWRFLHKCYCRPSITSHNDLDINIIASELLSQPVEWSTEKHATKLSICSFCPWEWNGIDTTGVFHGAFWQWGISKAVEQLGGRGGYLYSTSFPWTNLEFIVWRERKIKTEQYVITWSRWTGGSYSILQ